MKKLHFQLLILIILTGSLNAFNTSHSRQIPKLAKTSQRIIKSQQTLENIELILLEAHQRSLQALTGSYNAPQREKMDHEFQAFLTLIDPMLHLDDAGGTSMLVSDETIEIRVHAFKTLVFESRNLSREALGLVDLSTMTRDYTNESLPAFEDVMESNDKVIAAIREVRQTQLLFEDYLNKMSFYLPFIYPDYSINIEYGLENLITSRNNAQIIKLSLERALQLLNQALSPHYSSKQKNIMNSELNRSMEYCGHMALNDNSFQFCVIDGQTFLRVNTPDGILEFEPLDLTLQSFGLEGELSLFTVQEVQLLLPLVESAIEKTDQAIVVLDEYIEILSLYKDVPIRQNIRWRIPRWMK